MRKSIRKTVVMVVAAMMMMVTLVTSVAPTIIHARESATVSAEDATCYKGQVEKDEEFGGTFIGTDSEGFLKCGFKYGDSCDLTFSNGYEIKDVPFYSGYFGGTNTPAVVDYQGYESVCFAFCSGDSSWEKAGCADGDTVSITLNESGKYLSNEKTMSMVYSDDRNDFASDVVFANFREMKGGNLNNRLYRGASPVNNCHNRATYVDPLLEKNGIGFVLDLADNEEKLEGYQKDAAFSSDYYMSLYKDGKVALLGLNAAYQSEDFSHKLVKGLDEMSKCDGPYYIHCTEGKDRTGFVCILLEALGGCTYDEIRDDYMCTYDNYFGITKESNLEAYNAVDNLRFKEMMFYLTGTDNEAAARKADLVSGARQYLLNGGMTVANVSLLEKAITKAQ